MLAEGGVRIATHVVEEGGTLRFNDADPSLSGIIEDRQRRNRHASSSGSRFTPIFLPRQAADNPFDSTFAGYLVAKGDGATIKTPAKIDIDPDSGSDSHDLRRKSGAAVQRTHAPLQVGQPRPVDHRLECGDYQSTYELIPWSGQPPVTGVSKFTTRRKLRTRIRAELQRRLRAIPLAGAFTTFFTRVTRSAGSPPLTGLSVEPPAGSRGEARRGAVLPRLLPCPRIRLRIGTGAAELAAPSCPAASQVGTVNAGTGSGSPFYVNTGKVYLAGPYKGAPLSLAVVVPAVAGPFDLGNVADSRSGAARPSDCPGPGGLRSDPDDDPGRADRPARPAHQPRSRPRSRSTRRAARRSRSTATIEGAGGLVAQAAERFQIGECAGLGLQTENLAPTEGRHDTHGASGADRDPAPARRRRQHLGHLGHLPRLRAPRPGAHRNGLHHGSSGPRISARPPRSTGPSRRRRHCSTVRSPGNVYLRSSSHELPDLVTDLRGPGEPADQTRSCRPDGHVCNGRLRNTFEFIPDAPLSRVVLQLKGGKKGLLQNNTNICAHRYRATVRFSGHNGRTLRVSPKRRRHVLMARADDTGTTHRYGSIDEHRIQVTTRQGYLRVAMAVALDRPDRPARGERRSERRCPTNEAGRWSRQSTKTVARSILREVSPAAGSCRPRSAEEPSPTAPPRRSARTPLGAPPASQYVSTRGRGQLVHPEHHRPRGLRLLRLLRPGRPLPTVLARPGSRASLQRKALPRRSGRMRRLQPAAGREPTRPPGYQNYYLREGGRLRGADRKHRTSPASVSTPKHSTFASPALHPICGRSSSRPARRSPRRDDGCGSAKLNLYKWTRAAAG